MPAHGFLEDLLATYALVLVFVVALARLRVPPIVAMIAAGAVAGPSGLGLLATRDEVDLLAEIGIVLLLFTVGLDFSLADMLGVWRSVIGGGLLQIGGTAAAVAALSAAVAPGNIRLALFVGVFVALSSTAIVLKGLTERNQLDTPHGRLTIGILLLQDLAVVVLLLLVPILAGRAQPAEALPSLGRGILALAVVAAAGWLVMPALLRVVALSRRREAFTLAIVLASVGTAWCASRLGVSMALGAFLGGLVLAGGEFSHQAHAEVRPLRDILSSLFFVSLGSLLDFGVALQQWHLVLGLALLVMALKAVVATIALVVVAAPVRVALAAGIGLAQVGEFSFILGRAALESRLIAPGVWQLLLASSIVTMVATPALLGVAPALALRLTRRRAAAGEGAGEPPRAGHVIILGFGEGGRLIARALRSREIGYVALDLNASTVREERARGEPIVFGDVTEPDALHGVGVERARAVVAVLSDPFASARAVVHARALAPKVPVLVRTRYRREADRMRALGATEAVAEEIETSLEVLAQLLARLHVPGNVIEADLERLRHELPTRRPLRAPPARLDAMATEVRAMPVSTHQLAAGDWAVGRTLVEVHLRAATGVAVIGIRTGAGYVSPPPADRPLEPADVLYLLGSPSDIAVARACLARGPSRR